MKLVSNITVSGFTPFEDEVRIVVEFADGSAKDIKFSGERSPDRVAAALRTLAMAIGRDT